MHIPQVITDLGAVQKLRDGRGGTGSMILLHFVTYILGGGGIL